MTRCPLKTAYTFLQAHELSTEAHRVKETPDRFGVLRSAMVLDLLRRKALLDTFIADWWPSGASSEGRRRMSSLVRIYNRYKHCKDISQKGEVVIVKSHQMAA
jgi:hypothetical protein